MYSRFPTYGHTVDHLWAPLPRGSYCSTVHSAEETALRNYFQCLIACILDLIEVGNVDLEVEGSFWVGIGFDSRLSSFGIEHIEDLGYQPNC